MGCYYGGRLAQHGRDVRFLMRSDLTHVKKRGLRVRSHHGDFHLPKVQAFATPEEIGPVDVVIIALKATANAELERLIPPLLHEGTTLLTLQNGLGSDEFLAGRFGAERVVGGLCFVCINRTAPGEIHHMAQGHVSVGDFAGWTQPRTHEIATEFKRCGVPCGVVDSVARERWKKLAWNVPFNGLSIAAGGIDTARIMADPALAAEAQALCEETISAARTLGHELPASLVEKHMTATRTMGAYRPSSVIDFLAGRDVEVDAIWAEPLRRAQAAGAAVPRLALLTALIRSQVAARAK